MKVHRHTNLPPPHARSSRRTALWAALLSILVLAGLNYAFTSRIPSETAPAAATGAAVAGKPGIDMPLPDQDYSANPEAAMKRVRRLVRESGGDFRRLSASDQRMLDSMTGGHGAQMLRFSAKEVKTNPHYKR